MKNPLARRPWLFVVLAFIILIAAWTFLIVIAHRNKPETVPLKTTPVTQE